MSSGSENIDNIPAGVQAIGNDQQVNQQAIPKTSGDAPIEGLEPGENVPFADQVKGHAKMFAGKVFGNDKEVQQGAERILGVDSTTNNAPDQI